MPPLYIRPCCSSRGNEVKRIEENGLMLALFPQAPYTCITQELRPGDRILLYPDGGVADSQRSRRTVGTPLSSPPRQRPETPRRDRPIARIQEWSASQDDDLTVIVCDYAAI